MIMINQQWFSCYEFLSFRSIINTSSMLFNFIPAIFLFFIIRKHFRDVHKSKNIEYMEITKDLLF
jgi:hypothetical protein